MNNFFGQLRQKLSKPVLFGLYGAMGCLGAATIFGEPLLQLTKISPKVDQSPLAIVLLIDTSGSMNDDGKLREVKTAAQAFVERQDLSENRLAVFGFGTNVQAAASLTDNKPTLEEAIAQISDGGGTNMDQAILAATQELQSTPQRRNILLFTDGQPGFAGANLNREQAKTLEAMRIAASQNINLVAVATGDADTNFLAKLTGDPDRVFYVNSGDFEQAFRQAEKAIYSSQLVESGPTGNYSVIYSVLRIGGWTALLAIGTSLALIAGQNYYLRRRLLTPQQVGMGVAGGLMAGLVAGGVGQLLFIPFAGMPILAIGGRIIGWTILGSVVGGGMSFFVPNLQRGRAVQGGAMGGTAGAIGFLIISAVSGDLVGRLIGAAIIGFFIGLMIALIEQFSRESWLIVYWTPNEQTKINLGSEPVLLGSSENNHIYLRKSQGYPPITAKIYTEGEKIIMEFDEEMKERGMKILKQELHDGEQRKLGDVTLEVRTANSNIPKQLADS